MELDISAYHPTLLANLVDYRFDNNDVHKSFGKMYGTTYKKAKEITFKQLYGGIFPEYKEIEFFKRVQKYIDELWDKFQNEGYVEVPISKWKYYKLGKTCPKCIKLVQNGLNLNLRDET